MFALDDWPFVLEGSTEDLHIYERPDQYGLTLVLGSTPIEIQRASWWR